MPAQKMAPSSNMVTAARTTRSRPKRFTASSLSKPLATASSAT
jgi:hypothetical protein